jgi:hypothetical protein
MGRGEILAGENSIKKGKKTASNFFFVFVVFFPSLLFSSSQVLQAEEVE